MALKIIFFTSLLFCISCVSPHKSRTPASVILADSLGVNGDSIIITFNAPLKLKGSQEKNNYSSQERTLLQGGRSFRLNSSGEKSLVKQGFDRKSPYCLITYVTETKGFKPNTKFDRVLPVGTKLRLSQTMVSAKTSIPGDMGSRLQTTEVSFFNTKLIEYKDIMLKLGPDSYVRTVSCQGADLTYASLKQIFGNSDIETYRTGIVAEEPRETNQIDR